MSQGKTVPILSFPGGTFMPVPNIYSYRRLSFVFEKSVACFAFQLYVSSKFGVLENLVSKSWKFGIFFFIHIRIFRFLGI